MTLGPGGGSYFLPRRHVLIAGAVSLVGLTAAEVRTVPAAAHDDETTGALWSFFDQYRKLGQRASATLVLPGLMAQMQTIQRLAMASSGSHRTRLLVLGARSAELTGWMAQEAGDDLASSVWTGLAADLATRAGDFDLATYTLVRQAELALYRGDSRMTVDLARRVQAKGPVAARVRGLAAQREAQGHALAGDADLCRQALERAAHLSTAATGPGSATLGATTVTDPMATVTGWCLYDLGRPRESARVLESATAALPPTARRARARFGARLALAWAAAGEVDRACAATRGMLADAEHVESSTVAQDLRRLAHLLSRSGSYRPVQALMPQLVAAARDPQD